MKKYIPIFLLSLVSPLFSQNYVFPKNDSSFTNQSAYIEEYTYDLADNNGKIEATNQKLSQKMVIDWEKGTFQNISYNNLEHPYFYELTSFNKDYLITSRKYINNNNYTDNGIIYKLNNSDSKKIQYVNEEGKVQETYELSDEYGQSVIYSVMGDSSYKTVYDSNFKSLLSPEISKINHIEYSYENNELSGITERKYNNNIMTSDVSTGKYNWTFTNYFDENNRCIKSEDGYFTFVYKYLLDEKQNWIQKDSFTVENKFGHEVLVPSSRIIRKIQYGNTINLDTPETFYPYEEENSENSLSGLTSLPLWEIKYYVDSFGDPTDEAYLCFYLWQEGVFSNSATTSSKLNVQFLITNKNDISIKLYEYGYNEVKSSYGSQTFYISIKDQNNQVHSLSGILSTDRINLSAKDSLTLHSLLLENTELKFSLSSEGSTYKFTLKDNTEYSLYYDKLETHIDK